MGGGPGKVAGAFLFYVLTWLPLLGVLAVLRKVTGETLILDPRGDGRGLPGGCFWWARCTCRLGLFACPLTRSQIVAAMIAAAGDCDVDAELPSADCGRHRRALGRALEHISLVRQMEDFAGRRGLTACGVLPERDGTLPVPHPEGRRRRAALEMNPRPMAPQPDRPSFESGRRFRIGFSVTVSVVSMVAIVAMVNFWGHPACLAGWTCARAITLDCRRSPFRRSRP